ERAHFLANRRYQRRGRHLRPHDELHSAEDADGRAAEHLIGQLRPWLPDLWLGRGREARLFDVADDADHAHPGGVVPLVTPGYAAADRLLAGPVALRQRL